MKSYDLNLLLALDALLKTRSVTAAAEQLHLSVPAMSHTLARIRETFDDPILVRAGRQMVPTARALALAEPVAQLTEQARALREPPDPVQRLAQAHHLVVRAPDGLTTLHGGPLLARLRAVMPRVTLEFVPPSAMDEQALADGRVSLELGLWPGVDPALRHEVLSRHRLIGLARPDHAWWQGPPSLARWLAFEHVSVIGRPGEPSVLETTLQAQGLSRRVALTLANAYAAVVAVSQAPLLTAVSQVMGQSLAARLQLRLFDLPLATPEVPMVMVWHPRLDGDPVHETLRTGLRQIMAEGRPVPPMPLPQDAHPGFDASPGPLPLR